MAMGRIVNTHFWKDSYVIDLDPTEKLLFLYFLTNPRTTLAGVYEISLREVAFDTGIDKDMVQKILDRFCVDGKMYFEKSWLVLNNFIKHQRLNPSIVRGIEKAIDELPEWLQQKIEVDKHDDQQMSIFVPVTEQSDTSLGTTTPQLKGIKSNLKKLKEKKSNSTEPAAEATGGSNKFDKKQYALAARRDEELKRKEQGAVTRTTGKGYETFSSVGDQLKKRKPIS